MLHFVSPKFSINVSPKLKRGEILYNNGEKPIKEKKIYETRIRMSETDIKKLEYCCELTGKRKADVIRDGISEMYDRLIKGNK